MTEREPLPASASKERILIRIMSEATGELRNLIIDVDGFISEQDLKMMEAGIDESERKLSKIRLRNLLITELEKSVAANTRVNEQQKQD
ncbi:MAG: hypothetical protein AAB908_01280 [Patescibacteria group bacterium]